MTPPMSTTCASPPTPRSRQRANGALLDGPSRPDESRHHRDHANGTYSPIEAEVLKGLSFRPRTLSPWLFYDAIGSAIFERITELPEYYLTRTERAIFAAHAEQMISNASGSGPLTVLELGAGTATKTGVLLRAAVARQGQVVYRPIDVSRTALDHAQFHLERDLPGVTVEPQVADYTRDLKIEPGSERRLVLYIGSSIGNFSPAEAAELLTRLRSQLEPGDALLLGTDLAPGPSKDTARLLAAYDDAEGVTAEFNLNVLQRLNSELEANFDLAAFRHLARWNESHSRIEMHLQSMRRQSVAFPSLGIELDFDQGETIHTENSYKFTQASVQSLLAESGFRPHQQWKDEYGWFAVNLAFADERTI